eukprot:Partr_v1_DN26561_c0_g1_i3_m3639
MSGYVVDNVYDEMTAKVKIVHTIIRRAMESLIKNASIAQEQNDVANFLGFTDYFLQLVHTHHHHEDEFVFPDMAAKFPIIKKQLTGDHVKLAEDIKKMEEYRNAAAADTSKFDAKQFVKLVAAFQAGLKPHMKIEEDEITPATLKKAFPSDDDKQKLHQILHNIEKANSEAGTMAGMAFICNQMTLEERNVLLGAVPYVLREYVFPVFGLWTRGYWRYASAEGGQA